MECSSALSLPEGRGNEGCLALVASSMPSCRSSTPCSSQDTHSFTASCWYPAGISVCCQRNAPETGRAPDCCIVLQPHGWAAGESFLGRMTICWVFLKYTFFSLAGAPQYSSPWGPSHSALWEQDNIPYIFLQRNRFKYVQWKLSMDFRGNPQVSIAPIGPAVSCAQYTQTSLELNVKVGCFSF